MSYIRIKNWERHQHYKGRRPPWIKLHNALLDDIDYRRLPDISKAHLVIIWMLASCSNRLHPDGDPLIPEDLDYIRERGGFRDSVDLKPLYSVGFIIRYQDAIKVLSPCKQLVPPETEAETEAETERTKKPKPGCDAAGVKLLDHYETTIRSDKVSRPRAKKNIAVLLKTVEPKALWDAVEAYADHLDKKGTELRFRKVCANFFGPRDQVYLEFLPRPEEGVAHAG